MREETEVLMSQVEINQNYSYSDCRGWVGDC